jgi:protease-4
VGLKDRLKAAEENPNIKAVILRIDSPGGSVTAADLIHQEILRFKKRVKEKDDRDVPVIALMMDTAASGGLYVAMAADEIYALPTTVTGSIGVIMMLPGFQGLSNKIGFEMRVIKSGDNKDIGSPWRTMTEDERRIFQNLINEYYQHFLKVVLDSRRAKGLTGEKLNVIADGRVLDAATARDNNLIDGIMYPETVIERAKKLAGIEDARIVSYEYPGAYRGNIYAHGLANLPKALGGAGGGDVNLLKFDLGTLAGSGKKPQFMYMWMP